MRIEQQRVERVVGEWQADQRALFDMSSSDCIGAQQLQHGATVVVPQTGKSLEHNECAQTQVVVCAVGVVPSIP
jgi:hypothetical protein